MDVYLVLPRTAVRRGACVVGSIFRLSRQRRDSSRVRLLRDRLHWQNGSDRLFVLPEGRFSLVRSQEPNTRLYTDSALLHHLKKVLLAAGYDMIKKRMWKDGHMVDEHQQYVRSRKTGPAMSFAIWHGGYAINSACEGYNQRETRLDLVWHLGAKDGEEISWTG